MGNSVIYRPAYDAEVEYLESTGTQWIDTNVIPASSWKIEIEYMVTQMGCFLFGARTSYFSSDAFSSHIDSLGIFIQYDGNQERINGVGNSLNQRYKLIMSADGAFLDDVKIRDANSNTFTCPCNLYLFTLRQPNVDGTDRPFKGYIYYCKLWDNTNTLVRDFIPVRIGQIGYMYDKVSKQLFANKGTGNFILGNDVSNAVIPQQRCVLYFGNQRSVVFERIYEEYEWLKGDGTAYIDTLVKNLTNVHYIDILISVDGISSSSGVSHFFGRESVAPYYNSQVVLYYVPNRQNIAVWADSVGHVINFADIVGNVTLNLDTNIASTPTDSVEFSIRNYNSAFSIFLFANNNNGNAISPFIGKIKKLEIDNILYLIPCKLLQPIPAILDGNGIARQAGECGMWDKVNDIFYGNVASSGTFTVSND